MPAFPPQERVRDLTMGDRSALDWLETRKVRNQQQRRRVQSQKKIPAQQTSLPEAKGLSRTALAIQPRANFS